MKKIIFLIALAVNIFAAGAQGDKAIDFELSNLKHTSQHKLSDFKGEVVLLNLWASWCGGCKKEMPEFFALQKEYQDKFKIVIVSIDKNPEDSQKFLQSVEEKMGYQTPFLSLYDPEKSVAKAYRAKGMPSSYLIDKNGIIQSVMIGSLNHDDINELKQKIDKLQ